MIFKSWGKRKIHRGKKEKRVGKIEKRNVMINKIVRLSGRMREGLS